MFTGIVEEIGKVQEIKNGYKSSTIVIKADKVLKDTKLGDSISTNGVCLTVAKIGEGYFHADVMAETLRKSNLGFLNLGDKVNLERALTLNSRLGGHIVSGHIDGVGTIENYEKEDNATWIKIKASREIMKYVIYKGSITLDGVSLTVAYLRDNYFKVSIIPHTKEETTLLSKKIGATINIECDVIGKYVERLLGFKNENIQAKSNIDEEFLRINGFM